MDLQAKMNMTRSQLRTNEAELKELVCNLL